jgi:sortase A
MEPHTQGPVDPSSDGQDIGAQVIGGKMRIRLQHRFAERLLLTTGVTLLGIFLAALLNGSISSRRAIADFTEAQTAAKLNGSPPGVRAQITESVDFSLWSEKRILAYRESLAIKKDLPLGIIRIERLSIRAPIFEGTDDLVLNRGVGWIAGTAKPGDAGSRNSGIAGHRDGFFRGLKTLPVGDSVELTTLGAVRHYAVNSIEIVNPDNVSVLRSRGVPSLTLVTCYPFYFIGDAPQRFIVHASLKRQTTEPENSQNTGSAFANNINPIPGRKKND